LEKAGKINTKKKHKKGFFSPSANKLWALCVKANTTMKFNTLYLFALLLLFASCSKRNLAYFSDLDGQGVYTETIGNVSEPKIKQDDLLSITVNSLNPEANVLFNSGAVPSEGSQDISLANQGYLVNQEGYIDFPVLGKVKLGGLTKEEARNKLVEELQQYLKDPIVNIRYLNYRITVIGEVNRPSSFTIPSEKINILTAIGMAGDLTVFGKRENILLIREEAGVRTMTRVNLNSKEILDSPYFYLQQNDVVYVEPVKARAAQASLTRSNISIILSAASVLAIILTRLL
jgi:polysaccharide export outer membrane protein